MNRSRDEFMHPQERHLRPSEVAALFRVDPKTVTRWAVEGLIPFVWTLGKLRGIGHRRYREYDVRALLAGKPLPTRDEDGNVIDVGGGNG